jgi:hypothetical protein
MMFQVGSEKGLDRGTGRGVIPAPKRVEAEASSSAERHRAPASELDWTPRLIGALSDADRLIGRLLGEGGRLPTCLDPALGTA